MHTYSIAQFAALTGLSVKTLQRWDRLGKLTPARTPTNRRIYTEQHLSLVRGVLTIRQRSVVVYCRVSSPAQKSDLKNQRLRLEEFCTARGVAVDEWIEEIGGGLNFTRPKFVHLYDRIAQGAIKTLIIAHQDRLARFGFDLLRHICEVNDCQLVIMNTESLSPERELVEDLMAITHCFSARLYGLRNYKKTLKAALKEDEKGA